MERRVLAICSGGGHWAEMRRIMPAFADMDVSYASVHPHYQFDVPGKPYYTFKDFTRFNKRSAVRSAIDLARIVTEVRPSVVITTGAAPALIGLALSKILFRSKTVWIDSIANCDQLSTSGKLARLVADVWLTQWQHLSKRSGPDWWGAVL